MNCKVEHTGIAKAAERIHAYPFALLYCISQTMLCETKELGNFEITEGPDTVSFSPANDPSGLAVKECTEARFFSSTGEIHLFRSESRWEAVVISDTGPQEDTVTRTYELESQSENSNRIKVKGNQVKVKEYLDYDSDGQAYVRLTRLAGILWAEE